MLIAGYFYQVEIRLTHTQDHQCCNLKTVTIYLEEIETVFPESIVATEHIGSVKVEKLVRNRDQYACSESASVSDMSTTTIKEPRSFRKVGTSQQDSDKARHFSWI